MRVLRSDNAGPLNRAYSERLTNENLGICDADADRLLRPTLGTVRVDSASRKESGPSITEANDVSKDHLDIITRLSKLALEWKATLPTRPNPECLTSQSTPEKPKDKASKVTPEVRVKAFTRWDTNKDDIHTLDEYQAGLKGQDNLEARFKSFDKDGDNKLTREEFVGFSAR